MGLYFEMSVGRGFVSRVWNPGRGSGLWLEIWVGRVEAIHKGIFKAGGSERQGERLMHRGNQTVGWGLCHCESGVGVGSLVKSL